MLVYRVRRVWGKMVVIVFIDEFQHLGQEPRNFKIDLDSEIQDNSYLIRRGNLVKGC